MASKRCAGCGDVYRKGKIALVRDDKDASGWRRARVCSHCAFSALRIVSGSVTRCACGAPASTCAPCANKREPRTRAEMLKSAVKKLRGFAKAYRAANTHEENVRADAFEQSANLLESGDF